MKATTVLNTAAILDLNRLFSRNRQIATLLGMRVESRTCRAAVLIGAILAFGIGHTQTYRFDFQGWGIATGRTRTVTETSLVPIITSTGAQVLDLSNQSLRAVSGPNTLSGSATITALSNNGTAAGTKGNGFFYETPHGNSSAFQFIGTGSTIAINAITDRLEIGGSSRQGGLTVYNRAVYQRSPNESSQSLTGGLYTGNGATSAVDDLRQSLDGTASGMAVGTADTQAPYYHSYHFKRKVQSSFGGTGDPLSTRLSDFVPGASGFELTWAKINSRGDILIGFRDTYFVDDNRSWYSKVLWADGSETTLPFVGTGINRWGQVVGFDSLTLDYKVMTGQTIVNLRDSVTDSLGLEFKRRNQNIRLLDISDDGWVVGQSQLANTAINSNAYWFAAKVAPVPEPATMTALGLGALALLRRRRSA